MENSMVHGPPKIRKIVKKKKEKNSTYTHLQQVLHHTTPLRLGKICRTVGGAVFQSFLRSFGYCLTPALWDYGTRVPPFARAVQGTGPKSGNKTCAILIQKGEGLSLIHI